MINHSESVNRLSNVLDYFGILVLMWGGDIPIIYYGFSCNHGLRMRYWTIVRELIHILQVIHCR